MSVVGGGIPSLETIEWLIWEDSDRDYGAIKPLIARGLSSNLVGQDILGPSEAYVYKKPKGGVQAHPQYSTNTRSHRPSGPINILVVTRIICLGGAVAPLK